MQGSDPRNNENGAVNGADPYDGYSPKVFRTGALTPERKKKLERSVQRRRLLLISTAAIVVVAGILAGIGLSRSSSQKQTVPTYNENPNVPQQQELSWTKPEPVEPTAFPYDLTKFSKKNGLLTYSGQEKTFSGLDISEHQENVDWAAVKAEGFDFVMLRCGLRRGTVGAIAKDSDFEKNIEQAYAAGLKVGVYFFSQAINTDEAVEEAKTVLGWIEPFRDKITYPVAFDWEYQYFSDAKSRSEDVPAETVTECTIAFCEIIKSSGYTPMVYMNLDFYRNVYDMQAIGSYDFWLTETYDGTILFPYDVGIMQYDIYGRIESIDGDVDLNISFKDYSAQ